MSGKTTVTSIVGEEYKTWERAVIIDAGTGAGKTYFVINVLIPYERSMNKSVLFLCNRKYLYNQIRPLIEKYPGADLTLYQMLKSWIGEEIKRKKYDIIVVDESHYFLSDSEYNEYTSDDFDFVTSQKDSTVIFMSATGYKIFPILKEKLQIPEENIYTIPKIYDYVSAVHMYKAGKELSGLKTIIDDILKYKPDEKMLVYVRRMKDLKKLYEYYGSSAYYVAGSQQNEDFLTKDCIQNCQFDKRILFTTKALDNGVDLKDRQLKHIIVGLSDFDCILQAIGRKRPLDESDTCSFYFQYGSGQSMEQIQSSKEKDLRMADEYLADEDAFFRSFESVGRDFRKEIRENKLFFFDEKNHGAMKLNGMRYEKYKLDVADYKRIAETSYKELLFEYLGEELKEKRKPLDIIVQKRTDLLNYLAANSGKKFYDADKEALLEFINARLEKEYQGKRPSKLNKSFQKLKIDYEIISDRKSCEDNSYSDNRYWMIKKTN